MPQVGGPRVDQAPLIKASGKAFVSELGITLQLSGVLIPQVPPFVLLHKSISRGETQYALCCSSRPANPVRKYRGPGISDILSCLHLLGGEISLMVPG